MISTFKQSSYRWSPVALVLLLALACASLPEAGLDLDATEEPATVHASTKNMETQGEQPKETPAEDCIAETITSEPEGGCESVLAFDQEEPGAVTDQEALATRYDNLYHRASRLWEQGDFAACGPAFDQVVRLDQTGEHSADAAHAAVLCRDRAAGHDENQPVEALDEVEKRQKERQETCSRLEGDRRLACRHESIKPQEMSKVETDLLGAMNRYLCLVDQGEDVALIEYRRARLYYGANRFPEAATLFYHIAVNRSDDTKLAVRSANLYLDCLNIMGSLVATPNPACYDDLAAAVYVFGDRSKAPGNNLMTDKAFAEQIQGLKAQILRLKAEDLTKEGQYAQAADVYDEVYRDFKPVYSPAGLCEVLYNLALNRDLAGQSDQAVSARKQLLELFPGCPHACLSLKSLVEYYEATGQHDQSEQAQKQLDEKYPHCPDA